MTVFLDSSALVKRYVDERGTRSVIALMDADADWAASAAALAESEVAFCHRVGQESVAATLIQALRRDWPRFAIVPVDDECLARAKEIGCQYGTRILDSIHLAGADRLPRPVTFVTFERRQAAAAAGLGLSVRPSAI
jgi:predicted nucleic acid-binding protein